MEGNYRSERGPLSDGEIRVPVSNMKLTVYGMKRYEYY
jgi:hypothetical protein